MHPVPRLVPMLHVVMAMISPVVMSVMHLILKLPVIFLFLPCPIPAELLLVASLSSPVVMMAVVPHHQIGSLLHLVGVILLM